VTASVRRPKGGDEPVRPSRSAAE